MSLPDIYTAAALYHSDVLFKMRLPTGPAPSMYIQHLSPFDNYKYMDHGKFRDDDAAAADPYLRKGETSTTEGGGAPANVTFKSRLMDAGYRDDVPTLPVSPDWNRWFH